MIEKDIEKYLVRQVKQMGGLALKFVSPSKAGVLYLSEFGEKYLLFHLFSS